MKFSFVVLTWNRPQFLEKCLHALTTSIAKLDDCEIVVMDNGSTDRTPEIRAAYQDRSYVRWITRDKNYGLNAYKDLFDEAKGEFIVVVDDDVLEFPARVDEIFADYMKAYPEFGYLALNVVQDEHTNGAKPGPGSYTDVVRDGKTVQFGPTGGWCACFRRSNYRKLRILLRFVKLSMKTGEDGFLIGNFRRFLRLKSGIIKNAVCFHACGPYYAAQYGHLDREIAKYAESDLPEFVSTYEGFRDKPIS